jgi:hypothetical protein
LCASSFNFNLLSVSKITSSLNCVVTFFPIFCVFQDLKSRKLIRAGRIQDGLYRLVQTPVAAAVRNKISSII